MKLLLSIFTTCSIAANLYAQDYNNKFEIRGNIGYFSDAHAARSFEDNLFSHNTRVASSGIYSADVLQRIGSSNFMAELSFGYEQLNAHHKLDPKFSDKYYLTNYLAGIQYNYYKRPKYYAYSGLQLGVRTTNQTDFSERPKNRFDYDATFVGVRYGKKLGGFWEVGFGAKGFVRAGISYSF